VEGRLQEEPLKVFEGMVVRGEHFACSLCNPPFHTTAREAEAVSLKKQRALAGRTLKRDAKVQRNFGGVRNELVCYGGEQGFVTRMIHESAEFPYLCRWFSCLVSKSEHLPAIQDALKRVAAAEVRVIPMAQGQKKSRVVAWRF
jgi:23S rRNA (adenine1618-N6)-methyltransferase